MRGKPVKYEKIATAAFIIAIALALVAFYYIYKEVQYGRSLEGLQRYACVQYLKENPGETECPEFKLVQPVKQACCCDTGGTSRFHKFESYADVPKGSTEFQLTEACTNKCKEGGPRAMLLNVGRCSWVS